MSQPDQNLIDRLKTEREAAASNVEKCRAQAAKAQRTWDALQVGTYEKAIKVEEHALHLAEAELQSVEDRLAKACRGEP